MQSADRMLSPVFAKAEKLWNLLPQSLGIGEDMKSLEARNGVLDKCFGLDFS